MTGSNWKREISILAASGIIGTAIALTNHWQIATDQGHIYRLNRWTGAASICFITGNASDIVANGQGKFTQICQP
jgi:hypothetical protein